MLFLLVHSNLTCTWFEIAANKKQTIFSGQARDTGKLKNKAFENGKECATEFMTLADYVILRKKKTSKNAKMGSWKK